MSKDVIINWKSTIVTHNFISAINRLALLEEIKECETEKEFEQLVFHYTISKFWDKGEERARNELEQYRPKNDK